MNTYQNRSGASVVNSMLIGSNRKYHNVMEDLVAEEVNRQVVSLPSKLSKYIKRVEVETYALNRLPPLYASSKEGWMLQLKRGREELYTPIKTAVRQAIAAVQRDLLRNSTPLAPEDSATAKEEVAHRDSEDSPEFGDTPANLERLEQTAVHARSVAARRQANNLPDNDDSSSNLERLDQKVAHRHRAISDNYSRKEASIRDGWIG